VYLKEIGAMIDSMKVKTSKQTSKGGVKVSPLLSNVTKEKDFLKYIKVTNDGQARRSQKPS
jgi:hypothetical protein